MVKNVCLGAPQLGRSISHCTCQQRRQLPWKLWFSLGKDPSPGQSNAAFTQLLWGSHRKSYRSSVLPFNLLTVLQKMPKLPSVLHFSFQKLLPSTERELRVCPGIHFEKVIWRIAWEPESLWAAFTRPELHRFPKMFVHYSPQELIQMLWGS